MRKLEEKILSCGKVLPGNVLKVDSFLNNQLDIKLLSSLGKDIYKHFKKKDVTKIFTVESSGIALACLTATYFGCDVVFAKKGSPSNLSSEVYSAKCYSYTHKVENQIKIPIQYINNTDKILIIDDFLAHGEATGALMDIINQAGATLVGVGIAIEKGFQGAGDKMREQGIDLYSLAVIDKMDDSSITFR